WNVYSPTTVQAALVPGAPPRLLTDSGRSTTGYQEWTVATRPGQALRIVDRHLAAVPQRVQVSVEGQDAGVWFWPAAPGWDETAFLVPAGQITGPRTRIRVTLLPEATFSPLRVFAYWFYQ
ncbi:MAG TPA: hypothetical protein VM536_23585, partial [Chloroflexia bacterium]|nr:hypothetical protein [Chloroflexia bacterium]